MVNWALQKKWSDKFIPNIKRILGEYLISEAPIYEDQNHNTDLISLIIKPMRVACRVRRYRYLPYKDEFTLRSATRHKVQTELKKVLKGFGDYFFYGFSNETETDLAHWILADLDAFRDYYNSTYEADELPWCGSHYNKDGTEFKTFKIDDIPDFLIAKHETF